MRRPAALLLFVLVLVPGGRAAAGSLEDLASEIAHKATPGPDTALHVAARDPAAARLAQALGGLALARLDGAALVDGGAAAARRAGFSTLLEIEIGLENGEVVALGQVLPVEHDLWRETARATGGDPVASMFVLRARLDAELRALVGVAPPVPTPAAPARRWSFRAIEAVVDLGAPLLALAAADLDGDRRAELIALTTDELIVLRLDGESARILARIRLEGAAPLPRPRAPAGSLACGERIVARSSEHGTAASFSWQNGALVKTGGGEGFPTCAGSATLIPGTAIFAGTAPLPERFLAAGCGAGLSATVDAAGALRLLRPGDQTPWAVIPDVGTGFAIADLDGDGAPEVVAAGYRAPGTGDLLTVYRLAADGTARALRRPTPVGGGIAGIAAGDLDGDGAIDVVAAAREPGSGQVELWVLE